MGCKWFSTQQNGHSLSPYTPNIANLVAALVGAPRTFYTDEILTITPLVAGIPLTVDFRHEQPAMILTLTDVLITCDALSQRRVRQLQQQTLRQRHAGPANACQWIDRPIGRSIDCESWSDAC